MFMVWIVEYHKRTDILESCGCLVKVCNPSVTGYKGYGLLKETDEYFVSHGLKNSINSTSAGDIKEDLFGKLVPSPFQGAPTFDVGYAFGMVVVVLVSLIEENVELSMHQSLSPYLLLCTVFCLAWFINDFLNTIFFSSPTVALIVVVFLDNTVDYKDNAKDRGTPWWVKFRTFKGDNRNEKFYILPFNVNRFFPPS
ncbi:hypothetical protein Ddye_023504 [Dipteronia dyeriana]|uniref:Uncharacterized protein n=1 Tax=Dipteronia dyeriana TaxID=168575 RepID=A0AAD9TT72_9ROSI|nr:hypothetical protein Ddye_023504 [Dipteronia dyeriana]